MVLKSFTWTTWQIRFPGKSIELGLVAVPAAHAQAVANKLVAAGVSGILNFAPVTLSVPDGVSKVGVDLARELEQVTFRSGQSFQRSNQLAPCGPIDT